MERRLKKQNYNEESDEEHFLEVDVQCLQKLYELHNDLEFLPEKMKVEKVEKLVANLHDKTDYVIHIRNLNKALSYGLLLNFIKPFIDLNTYLRKKAKNYFEKKHFLS